MFRTLGRLFFILLAVGVVAGALFLYVGSSGSTSPSSGPAMSPGLPGGPDAPAFAGRGPREGRPARGGHGGHGAASWSRGAVKTAATLVQIGLITAVVAVVRRRWSRRPAPVTPKTQGA